MGRPKRRIKTLGGHKGTLNKQFVYIFITRAIGEKSGETFLGGGGWFSRRNDNF